MSIMGRNYSVKLPLVSTVFLPHASPQAFGQNTAMIEEVLARITERLEVVGLSESAAAKRAGLSADAIRNIRRQVERGNLNSGASTRTLGKLAPVLETTIEWLMTGKGDGETVWSTVPVMGLLGAGAEVDPDFEQVPVDGIEQIEVPFLLPDDMVAFRVTGVSMLPVFKDGTIIIVYRNQKRPLHAFYGEEAAVRTADGRRYIKTIMRGQGDTVNLISWNAQPIENVRLEWIGEIFATLPGSSIRKVERRGGIQGQLRLKTA